MIVVALGSNLPLTNQTEGTNVLRAAAKEIENQGITILAKSRLYKSEPVPISDQNWYVNAAISIETKQSPQRVLAILHEIEAGFGRQRTVRNAARTLDLDIIDFNGQILADDKTPPILPHPRMDGRAFVLLPLRDLNALWCHPVTGAVSPPSSTRWIRGKESKPLKKTGKAAKGCPSNRSALLRTYKLNQKARDAPWPVLPSKTALNKSLIVLNW